MVLFLFNPERKYTLHNLVYQLHVLSQGIMNHGKIWQKLILGIRQPIKLFHIPWMSSYSFGRAAHYTVCVYKKVISSYLRRAGTVLSGGHVSVYKSKKTLLTTWNTYKMYTVILHWPQRKTCKKPWQSYQLIIKSHRKFSLKLHLVSWYLRSQNDFKVSFIVWIQEENFNNLIFLQFVCGSWKGVNNKHVLLFQVLDGKRG